MRITTSFIRGVSKRYFTIQAASFNAVWIKQRIPSCSSFSTAFNLGNLNAFCILGEGYVASELKQANVVCIVYTVSDDNTIKQVTEK